MNGEEVPVQIRIWFADGGEYDLHGTLSSFQQDNEIATHTEGMHTFNQIVNKVWTLTGRAHAWEFDKNGKPDVLAARPQLAAPKRTYSSGAPDRSSRARRRARAKARKRHAT